MARRSLQRPWLLARSDEWILLGMAAMMASLLLYPLYVDDSMWIGLGVFVATAAFLHTMVASRRAPWIPGLIVCVASLQWVVIPWIAYHVPPSFARFAMIVDPPRYFSYTVPAVIALLLGLYVPAAIWGRARAARPRVARSIPGGFRKTCDLMVFGGVLLSFALPAVVPGSLRFAIFLLGNLSFVGAFGLLVLRVRGWHWRLLFVMGAQTLTASVDGMFHDLVLWMAYLAVILAFAYRLRTTVVATFAVAAVVIIFLLNVIKSEYRTEVALTAPPASERVFLLGSLLANNVLRPEEALTAERISLNVTRLNQGWIIARILQHVPDTEPHAEGETISAALVAALLPRFLAPDKLTVGRGLYFERFTGVPLRAGTSMDLSLAGEMYANFGRTGGLLGTAVFGLLVGLVFARISNWAFESSLWWAWVPFLLLPMMKAESGVGEAINYLVKAAVVMAAVITLSPAWAALRRWGILRRTAARLGVRKRPVRPLGDAPAWPSR